MFYLNYKIIMQIDVIMLPGAMSMNAPGGTTDDAGSAGR